jgi:DNA polymerase-3 subunit delta
MKKIATDIKNGTFSNVYLLYGEEAYLRKQYRDNLRNALIDPSDNMNCSVFSGDEIDINEVTDLAGTMPFFAERRVLVIENSGWLKPKKGKSADEDEEKTSDKKAPKAKSKSDKILELINNIPDTTYLILVEETADKRSKLFKAITSKGYCALCEMQDEDMLKRWILGLLKKENKLITGDALELLLDKTGTNMENIKREVEKLICYKYDEEGITATDVENLCVEQIQNQIFDMVEAVAVKDQKRALELYYNLIALKEAPVKILALIARQFNMLLQVREMNQKGYPESEIATTTGLNAYYLKKKYIPQSKQFRLSQLEDALRQCVEAEENIKMGKMSDTLSVELIIVGLSSKAKKEAG